MNKLFRCCWAIGLCAMGCSGAPVSDGSIPAGDDQQEGASAGEQTSNLVVPGFCVKDSDCTSSNAYCKFRDGVCEGRGICETRARICQQIFAPVCGCDGRTYPNACVASRAGVSLVHQGACEARPICGGLGGLQCPKPSVCVDDPSDSCDPRQGDADCTGICICKATALCPPGTHWDASPAVCACVPDPNPCATVLCPPGEHCVVKRAAPTCEPIPKEP